MKSTVLWLIVAFGSFGFNSAQAPKEPFIVVIDAGHGGKDIGASVNEINEKNLMLSISNLIKEKTGEYKHVEFIFTRKTDAYVPLHKRIKLTKESMADLYISLHVNKSKDAELNGLEIYTSRPELRNDVSYSLIYAKLMAKRFQNDHPKLDFIGIEESGFFVNKNSNCPAILLEIGFLSNAKDRKYIINSKNQENIANSIIQGILEIARSQNRGIMIR